LLKLLREMTRTAIARRVGISPNAVGHWASGRKIPLYRGRAAALRELGISLSAWDEPPSRAPLSEPSPAW
jgi:transcriptional regulator with XRE-family HTH domain